MGFSLNTNYIATVMSYTCYIYIDFIVKTTLKYKFSMYYSFKRIQEKCRYDNIAPNNFSGKEINEKC